MEDGIGIDRADRWASWLSVGVTALGGAGALTVAARRVVEVASGTEVPVTVGLAGQDAPLALGPGGGAVQAQADVATVMVPRPTGTMLAVLYAQPIWTALVVCTVLAFVALFLVRLARNRTLARGTGRLVVIAGSVGIGGWAIAQGLGAVVEVWALDVISEGDYDRAVVEFSILPFYAVLLVGAVAAAIQVGERLKQDTDGLV